MFDPLYSLNNDILFDISDFVPPSTQVEGEFSDFVTPSTQLVGDQILPTFDQHDNNLDNLLINQTPTFIDNPTIKPNPKKRSLAINHHDQENNGMNHPNDSKKRQKKMIHREIERKRRLEMSSLHTSLKSLLPVEYIKGKRSISDHVGEAVKYIKQMQQKTQVLNKKRDALREEVSNFEGHKFDVDEVIVNVLKESVEVIVSTNCRENDGNEGQGLPLSKVLKCLIEQGLDVVSSSSKRVNTNLVHSIHAQVGNEGKIVIDATNLKNKIANIQR